MSTDFGSSVCRFLASPNQSPIQNRSPSLHVHPENSSSNLYTVYLFSYYAYSIAEVYPFVNQRENTHDAGKVENRSGSGAVVYYNMNWRICQSI